MSLWSRISNVFREDRLNREIEEEFEAQLPRRLKRAVIQRKRGGRLGRWCGKGSRATTSG